jgi:hypothetical protein
MEAVVAYLVPQGQCKWAPWLAQPKVMPPPRTATCRHCGCGRESQTGHLHIAVVHGLFGFHVKAKQGTCTSRGLLHTRPSRDLQDAEGFGHRGLLAGGRCGYGLKCYRDQLDRSSLVGARAVGPPIAGG